MNYLHANLLNCYEQLHPYFLRIVARLLYTVLLISKLLLTLVLLVPRLVAVEALYLLLCFLVFRRRWVT